MTIEESSEGTLRIGNNNHVRIDNARVIRSHAIARHDLPIHQLIEQVDDQSTEKDIVESQQEPKLDANGNPVSEPTLNVTSKVLR